MSMRVARMGLHSSRSGQVKHVAAVYLLLLVLALSTVTAPADQGVTTTAAARDMESANQVFDRMFPHGLTEPQRARIAEVLKNAYGFVALPNIQKMGVLLSQVRGRGALIYRDEKGVWQPPLPLLVTGTSLGPHFGLIAYDSLIPLRSPLDINKLFQNPVTFAGRDVIGPVQVSDVTLGDTVAYSRARGISVGISQDAVHIALDQASIAALYGINVQPHELFSGKLENCRKPLPVQKLIERANEFATGAPIVTILSTP